jgi:hypothetical protein
MANNVIRIHKEQSEINVLDGSWNGMDLMDLKEWCEYQLSQGKRKVNTELIWGCYRDADEVNISISAE